MFGELAEFLPKDCKDICIELDRTEVENRDCFLPTIDTASNLTQQPNRNAN